MSSVTPTEVGSFFLSLIVPITTGVVAAGFTAFFALNRFYREKWWEKKHIAYNQLIDKLFEIKAIYNHASDFYEADYNAQVYNKPAPKGSVDWDGFHRIKAQIHRFYVLAPISLSHNTKELLNSFFKQDADTDRSVYEGECTDFVAYNEMAIFMQKLIDAIVIDAEKELKFK